MTKEKNYESLYIARAREEKESTYTRTRREEGEDETWYNQEVYELTTLGNVAFAALEQMQLDLPCNRNKSNSSSNNDKGEGQGAGGANSGGTQQRVN